MPADTTILYASYGVYNRTMDVTDLVTQRYLEGVRTFYASNDLTGQDPAPGETKYLYIFWNDGSNPATISAVVVEDSGVGITLQ